MIEHHLIDSMDIQRPNDPPTVTPPEVAADFAHLIEDYEGDEDGEESLATGVPCALFEKTKSVVKDGKKEVVIDSVVYTKRSDIKVWDRLLLTPRGGTQRTFVVYFPKAVQGLLSISHYALTVSEVR